MDDRCINDYGMAQIKRKSEKEMYQWRNMGAEGANTVRMYGEVGMQDAEC